jgi:actin-like ATPase involved in cell morphogenesis
VADWHLGIDFGTSTTVGCLRWPDGRVRPLLFDGSPLLPSAVYLDDDGRLLVGRDALHTARAQPARFEPNPKQRIDEGSVLLGAEEVPVATLIAAVLRRVMQEAAAVTGGQPVAVTMSYPATWAEHRRRSLLDAATAAGIATPALVTEPISAASYFDAVVRDRARPAGTIIVYDLGAGTFDVSVVTRTPAGLAVRATDGLADVGGLDVDATIVAYLGAALGESADAEAAWTRLEQPATPADLRARRQLWEDARTAKEMLSRASSTVIYVPLVDHDVLLGRAQFERLVRPLLDRTVATTRSALRQAALDPAAPLDMFLVGGASRVPLIATLLHRALGVPPTVIEQPELAVAEGCLTVSAAPAAPAAPVGPAGPVMPVPPAVVTPGPPAALPAHPQQRAAPGVGPPVPVPRPAASSGLGPPPLGPPGLAPPPLAPPGRGPAVPGRGPVASGPRPARAASRAPGPRTAPTWTDLVQVLDLAVGETGGYTLRCYLPPDDPEDDPDAMFLSRGRRLMVFSELPDLVGFVRSITDHDLAELPSWDVVTGDLSEPSANEHLVEAYELELIMANLQGGHPTWDPALFVAARDLIVELSNALRLTGVRRYFLPGAPLDRLDDLMRAAAARQVDWWRGQRMRPDDVASIRDMWWQAIGAVESAITLDPP